LHVLIPVLVPAADLPAGWIKAGSAPAQYDMGVDRTTDRREGRTVAFIKGTADRYDGFGTLMQMASPGEFRGKRVRLSADVKSEGIESAGLASTAPSRGGVVDKHAAAANQGHDRLEARRSSRCG
jgi:hypothetical protein